MVTLATQETVTYSAALEWQPEHDLIQSAQDGDSAAFEALMSQYQDGVRLQCLRKGLSQDDMSDVRQDVFVKVLRNLPRYRHDTAFQTWLYRVTENCIYDHFRRRGRYLSRHEPIPSDDQDREMEFPSTIADPERTADVSLLSVHLERALNLLSVDQRETFLRKEVQGMKYEEIAELEGCSVGTIKSRIFRARQIMMRELQEWI